MLSTGTVHLALHINVRLPAHVCKLQIKSRLSQCFTFLTLPLPQSLQLH